MSEKPIEEMESLLKENDELIAMSEQQSIEKVRTKNTSEIGETKLALDELTSEHIGIFVTLKSIHFLVEEHGKPLVAAKDWYDTQRQKIQCVENTTSSFLLETSRFADFSDLMDQIWSWHSTVMMTSPLTVPLVWIEYVSS